MSGSAEMRTGGRAPGSPRARLVRPYTLVGGRTRATADDLPLEALVVTTEEGRRLPDLAFEARAIVERCARPHAVAELAAHLDVPLGVARVLVTDLATVGLVRVHGAESDRDDASDVALLQRVLDGVQDL